MTPPARILNRLHGLKECRGRYMALCPAHDDKEPSLSIGYENSKVLLKCHAGCTVDAICKAIGINTRDLFDDTRRASQRGRASMRDDLHATIHLSAKTRGERHRAASDSPPSSCKGATQPIATASNEVSAGCTLQAYADLKRLPVECLKGFGISEITYCAAPALKIPYLDDTGQELAVRFRIAADNGNARHDRFRWRKGDKPCLYGLHRLGDARNNGDVVLCEGESDCHTLWYHGYTALGIPGATNLDAARDSPHLEGIDKVYVIVEPDKGGETVRTRLSTFDGNDRIYLVNCGSFKDPSELHVDDPDRFRERFDAILATAVPLQDELDRTLAERTKDLSQQCREIAEAPDILALFAGQLEAAGAVGVTPQAKLLFLALVSRLLDRPISAVIKAPSACGKSFLIDSVRAFFPESAYLLLTSMSAKALLYMDEPLVHRFLIVAEMPGISGEMNDYFIRSLLSEGRLTYRSVEFTRSGHKPINIQKPGPTGLLTTTTAASLHAENETRLLEINLPDTREQTRRIMESLARRAAEDERPPESDLASWHAHQEWLAVQDNQVVIPYAMEIQRGMPENVIRLRRDTSVVFSLIQSCAILHQANRQRDEKGRILAGEEDYRIAYELAQEVFTVTSGVAVSSETRETVDAVKSIIDSGREHASVLDVAEHLGIDKSTASRRVRVAIRGEYVADVQGPRKKGRQLVIGNALPEQTASVLPSPTSVFGASQNYKCAAVAPAHATKQDGSMSVPTASSTDSCTVAATVNDHYPLPPAFANLCKDEKMSALKALYVRRTGSDKLWDMNRNCLEDLSAGELEQRYLAWHNEVTAKQCNGPALTPGSAEFCGTD